MSTLSLFAPETKVAPAAAVIAAGRSLTNHVARQKPLDSATVRNAMNFAFLGTDANGAWDWRLAYEAYEVAMVSNIRRLAIQFRNLEDHPDATVAELEKYTRLGLTHSRRSEDQIAMDQWSTPAEVGALVALAAQIRQDDKVLEPSAGTGLLAIFAEIMGADLSLNELAETRHGVLAKLFPAAKLTRIKGQHVNDRVAGAGSFDIVIMNPPFTEIADHLDSAFKALAPNGRLCSVVPVGYLNSPGARRLAGAGAFQAAVVLPKSAFYKHGTTVETAIIVVDKLGSCGSLPATIVAQDLAAAIRGIKTVPDRVTTKILMRAAAPSLLSRLPPGITRVIRSTRMQILNKVVPIPYSAIDWKGSAEDFGLFSGYQVSRIDFACGTAHPAELVESSAMATIAPPKPTVIPHVPPQLINGGLSKEQLEVVVYAAQAHSEYLPGQYVWNDERTDVKFAPAGTDGAFKIRRGFFNGDGTGLGKGRTGASLVMATVCAFESVDKFKAIYVSKNDDLLEDFQRDWTALGGAKDDVVPLSAYGLGEPLRMDRAVLFVTYGTLRVAARQGKKSRLQQIIDWVGHDFAGALIFDESHEMANAAGGKGNRGNVKPSLQGLAGLALQHGLPEARVTYQSATGATTPQNLGYAFRLGLWGAPDAPFMTRDDFLTAANSGGVGFMEAVARELKAQGLYMSRMLSFSGIEIDPVLHELTADDIEIWDSWADAWSIIWANLEKALLATGIVDDEGTNSGQAKSAARSAFAGTAQRFFCNLLSGLKAKTVITCVEKDLAEGKSSVIQLINTNEASLNRHLQNVLPGEENDLNLDLSTKDQVLNYLQRSFPTTLLEVFEDAEGKKQTRPVTDQAGRPVECREAAELRDELVLSLAILPSIPGILDQLLHAFGPEAMAEATGRSQRVIIRGGRQVLQKRPSTANSTETDDFMSGRKRIIAFSQAGGTGRSYHSDLNCLNRQRRVHYILEFGYRADVALQGLGRTNRSNQASKPIFRPTITNIEGERRFLSTIARRLDSLGALTKGERRSNNNGMFRPEDNLESPYARRALNGFITDLHRGKIEALSMDEFEAKTALELRTKSGLLKETDEFPGVPKFLNRLLCLRIADQNRIFGEFVARLTAILATEAEKGTLDQGIEDIVPHQMEVISEQVIRVDRSGAESKLMRFDILTETKIVHAQHMLQQIKSDPSGTYQLLGAGTTDEAVVAEFGCAVTDGDDCLISAVKLHRPTSTKLVTLKAFQAQEWLEFDEATWSARWEAEVAATDPVTREPLWMVTGLLLPLWQKMPASYTWIRRLKATDGRRWLGRKIDERDAAKLLRDLGLTDVAQQLKDPLKIMDRLALDERIRLTDGLWIKRSRLMNEHRFEIFGNDREYRALKALGCFVEIVSGQARVFIPIQNAGLMRQVIERYPAQEITRGSQAA